MFTRGNYKFLDKTFENEKDFALALSQNYGDALNFIFTTEFRDMFVDSYLRGRVNAEIKRCKYAESALTMVIYLLNPSLGLCVRGKYFKTLHDLALFMYNSKQDKPKTIIHLFQDHCITHTLGLNEELNEKLRKDIVYVEDHIEDDSIYEYFVSLFGVKFKQTAAHGLSAFDYFIYGVKNEKDRFQAYLNLLNDPSFKSSLYEQYSIPEVLKMYSQKDAPFAILKTVGEEVTVDLAPIVDSGINLWLCNNIKNFKFKRKAKLVKKLLIKAKSYADKLETVEDKINFSEKMYNVFKAFVNFYDCNLIKAKSEDYEFKYYLNNSRGCRAYYLSINVVVSDEQLIEPMQYSKANKKIIIKHTNNELKQYLGRESKAINDEKVKEEASVSYQMNKFKKYRSSFILTLLVSLILMGLLIYNMAFVTSFSFENLFGNLALCIGAFGAVYSLYGLSKFGKKIKLIEENFLDDEEEYELQKQKRTILYNKTFKKYSLAVLFNDLTLSAVLLVMTIFGLICFNYQALIVPYQYYLIAVPFVYVLLNVINRKFKLINFVIYLLALTGLVLVCVLL